MTVYTELSPTFSSTLAPSFSASSVPMELTSGFMFVLILIIVIATEWRLMMSGIEYNTFKTQGVNNSGFTDPDEAERFYLRQFYANIGIFMAVMVMVLVTGHINPDIYMNVDLSALRTK